jgi:cysteine desulfurase
MLANNESGVLQDIPSISGVVRSYGGVMHSDCSQAIGKIKFNFAELGAHAVTASGNKMHAGLGGGILMVESGFEFKPFILGGGQQNYKRGGTENVLQIFALSNAFEKVNCSEYLAGYECKTSSFQKRIEETVRQNGGEVFGLGSKRLCNTSLIKMPGINNFTQMMEFDLAGICISVGSACSSGRTDVSKVLKVCGISQDEATNYIRVSSGIFNQEQEIEEFCNAWLNLLRRR